MTDFSTVKDAKDFLAQRIAAEAARENVPLSEVERKMLCWSESDWTLSDKNEVGEEFEQDYDQREYEHKIACLIANIVTDHHHQNEAEEEKWDAAVKKLNDGDHYIQVLISEAERVGGASPRNLSGIVSWMFSNPVIRTPRDFGKALLVAFALIFVFFALQVLADSFFESSFWSATGWDISDREKGFLTFLTIGVVCFLGAKLWQVIRSRSNRS